MQYINIPTWEDIVQIPGQDGVKDSIKDHHEDGDEEGVGVFL